jgi:hypothetical protein
MALARCILGKFLVVVCHCFPLPLDVPTFAARCLHVPINASAPSSEMWNGGRELSGNFAEMTPFFLRHLGIFYMQQICDMGQKAKPFARIQEASLLTTRPPKPLNGVDTHRIR